MTKLLRFVLYESIERKYNSRNRMTQCSCRYFIKLRFRKMYVTEGKMKENPTQKQATAYRSVGMTPYEKLKDGCLWTLIRLWTSGQVMDDFQIIHSYLGRHAAKSVKSETLKRSTV